MTEEPDDEMERRLNVGDVPPEDIQELTRRLESGERVHAQEILWDVNGGEPNVYTFANGSTMATEGEPMQSTDSDNIYVAVDFWDAVHDHLTLDHGVQVPDATKWINEFRESAAHDHTVCLPATAAVAVLAWAKDKAVADGIDPPTLWACDGCGLPLTPAGEHRWTCENPKCRIQTVAW